ncbi:MAG: hypothetical protein QOJ20_2012, partial [Mycobacterium sp.]|nr:hypothetical protein [Mycobacterium sp.]
LWSMTTTQPTRIGKTTVAACVGLSFAQVRQDDRVVVIHADTAFGKLGARIDPHATGSAMPGPDHSLFPSSSQFAATFLLGCTRGGSPGIFG